MDSTTMAPEDPLELAREAADARGWSYYFDTESDAVLYVELPSKYKQLILVLRWSEMADLLILRIYTPLTFVVPVYAINEFYKLLNLCNTQSLVGAWHYELSSDGRPLLMWRQEIPTDQSNLTAEQMQVIMSSSSIAHDTFFPAFMAFLGAKPKIRAKADGTQEFSGLTTSADEAARHIDRISLCGRA